MARNPKPALFLSPDEQEQVKAAVAAAELLTSGEIRVYMEARIPWFRRDPYVRARQVFARLGMHATGERNGVLVYLATRTRKFAVLGDEKLHERVGEAFWNDIRDLMAAHFREDRFVEGLAEGIALVGERLRENFPHREDDVNELSDEISY